MNRKNILTGTAVLLGLALLTGCGRGRVYDIEPDTTMPPITSYAEAEDIAPDARELINALDTADKIAACALPYDESLKYTDENGTLYYKAADPRFKCCGDVRVFLDKYMTKEYAEAQYPTILDTDTPVCIDINGELYTEYAPKGGRYSFTDAEPITEKLSENEYTVIAENNDYGAAEKLRINVIKEDGRFKINAAASIKQ